MVRLKDPSIVDPMFAASNFNSTMVRLKVLKNHLLKEVDLFQFHYGTIKRWMLTVYPIDYEISIPLWYD